MITSPELREYLRLPPDDTENLDTYIAAAVAKARAAGVPMLQNNAQYDLFILSLAAMYYDNRAMGFSGTYQQAAESNARAMINAFVLELRYSQGGDGT